MRNGKVWQLRRVGDARVYLERNEVLLELMLAENRKRVMAVSIEQLDFITQAFIELRDGAVRGRAEHGVGHVLSANHMIQPSPITHTRFTPLDDGRTRLELGGEDGRSVNVSMTPEQFQRMRDMIQEAQQTHNARSRDLS